MEKVNPKPKRITASSRLGGPKGDMMCPRLKQDMEKFKADGYV